MENQSKNGNIIAIITMMFLYAMISFVTNLAAPIGVIWKNVFADSGSANMFAHTEEVLQSLGSLDGSEHTSDGTQDSCLATGRNSACWRWLLEETTVTSRAWKMGEGLPLESQDAAMRECLAQSHTGIIDEELHREVVGAINDEIPWLDDFLGIV